MAAALERAISTAILDGHVARGMRLPSERALADALGVSRVTVSAAYSGLRMQGWIDTIGGAGSHAQLPAWLDAQIDLGPGADGEVIDLARASPMAPLPAYLAALERAADRLAREARRPFAEMLPELRAAVADRYTRVGVPTRPEEVLLTTGAGAALALVTRQALRPGARVLVESPTYPGALDLLRSAGVRIAGWPMVMGWDTELFDALTREFSPDAAYLIFDFHNPTGALASDSVRYGVVCSARRSRTMLILDETMCELDLRGDQAAPLGRDAPGAFRLGSLAKTVWAGLRVGWLRGPSTAIEAIAALPESYYLTPPILEQLVALELFDDLDSLIAARRGQLATQLETLWAVIDGVPGIRLTRVPAGGLTTWTELTACASSAELTRRAAEHGLRLLAGGRFSPDGTQDRFLRVPFGLPSDTLETAGKRLTGLLESACGAY